MQRGLVISAAMLCLTSCAALDPTAEQLQAKGYKLLEVEEVFTAEGTMKQLAQRAATCASKNLRFDAFQISDAGKTAGLLGGGVGNQLIPGGNIIVSQDIENGVIVANSRTPTTFFVLRLMIQSTVTIDTKDGKYRIRHTNVENAAGDSGSSANNGFRPVLTEAGSAKQVTKALNALSKRLADCISSTAVDKDF